MHQAPPPQPPPLFSSCVNVGGDPNNVSPTTTTTATTKTTTANLGQSPYSYSCHHYLDSHQQDTSKGSPYNNSIMDLSHLTDEEQHIIQSVMMRQKAVEEEDAQVLK